MSAGADYQAPWRVVGPATALAVALGIGYLLAPKMGTDLSAQVAHADFFRAFQTTPVDLRWYGGSEQFGYSLLSPVVMAVLRVRVTGALALVASSALFALLLVRTRVPRPLFGALVGAVCIAGNLVSGRVTWALGVAFGLAAVVLLAPPARPTTPTGPAGPVRGRRWAWWGAGVAALLASATSPVAGLFLGLVAAALLVTAPLDDWRRVRGRVRDGLLVGVAAALPLLVTSVLFGDGGWMNTGRADTVHAAVTGLVVAALVPRRILRAGALLSSAGVLAAAVVDTPVGLNATRLAVMFALPTLAAAAALPAAVTRRAPDGRMVGTAALVALLAVGYWWQPPLLTTDLRDHANPTSDPGFFTPLRAQLTRLGVTGRVEIPPTRDYWESAYLDGYPLARGWLRQVDIARNPLFFGKIPDDGGTGVPLTAASYRDWLAENAVQWVALPDAPMSWVGLPEDELVETGLPYLTQVWSDAHWRLYAVANPVPIVAAPATIVSQDAAYLTFDAPAPGDIMVRIRWTRWLTVTRVDKTTRAGEDATARRDGDWVTIHVSSAGRYTISSSLTG